MAAEAPDNVVEQDNGSVKRHIQPMVGFKSPRIGKFNFGPDRNSAHDAEKGNSAKASRPRSISALLRERQAGCQLQRDNASFATELFEELHANLLVKRELCQPKCQTTVAPRMIRT